MSTIQTSEEVIEALNEQTMKRVAQFVSNTLHRHNVGSVLIDNASLVLRPTGKVQTEVTHIREDDSRRIMRFEYKGTCTAGFLLEFYYSGHVWSVQYALQKEFSYTWFGHNKVTTARFKKSLEAVNRALAKQAAPTTTERHTPVPSTPAQKKEVIDITPFRQELEQRNSALESTRRDHAQALESLQEISRRRDSNAKRLAWIKEQEAELEALRATLHSNDAQESPEVTYIEEGIKTAQGKLKPVDDTAAANLKNKVTRLSAEMRDHETTIADLRRRIKGAQRR